MSEKLWLWIPAGAARKFSSPALTLCADSYSGSIPPCVTAVASKRPQSFCQKCRWQVTSKHAYILDPAKSEWADYAVQAQYKNLSGKWTHMQLICGHSTTVISDHWASVNCSWPKKWNWCAWADLYSPPPLPPKKHSKVMNRQTFPKSPLKWLKKKKPPSFDTYQSWFAFLSFKLCLFLIAGRNQYLLCGTAQSTFRGRG